MRLAGIIVLSFICTILVESALLLKIPGELSHRMIWTGLSVPFIWPLAMLYCYWDTKPWRPFVMYLIASVICSLVILSHNQTPIT